MNHDFSHLLSPGSIGSLELRNRILVSAMGTNLSAANGHCSPAQEAFYNELARGGAALVTLGSVAVSWPCGSVNPHQVALSDDRFVASLKALAERIHSHDCRLAVQLQHGGLVALNDMLSGRGRLGPMEAKGRDSDIGAYLSREEMKQQIAFFTAEGVNHEVRTASAVDLRGVVDDFATAAERARRAGVDAIEIHAGHGYLLSSFLSPHSNQRDDDYGGTAQRRARLMIEVVVAVRGAVGADFPIWCRIDGNEFYLDDGITPELAEFNAQQAEAAGADAISVSAYADSAKALAMSGSYSTVDPGGLVGFATRVKRTVSVPVITAGRIDPPSAERLIAAGDIDFVAMARQLLADPELPAKLAAGRAAEIRPCAYGYHCISEIFHRRSVRCAVNAAVGQEANPIAVSSSRSVLVVGGGTAGLEAARVAAACGHRVTLLERRRQLGGLLLWAAAAQGEYLDFLCYLLAELERAGVALHCGIDVDNAELHERRPDVVLWAVGNAPVHAELPVAEGSAPLLLDMAQLLEQLDAEVDCSPSDARSQAEALRERIGQFGNGPVAVLGAGAMGLGLARLFAGAGRAVTVLEPESYLGGALPVVRRARDVEQLRALGVSLLPQARISALDGAGLRYRLGEGDDAQEQHLDCGQLIVALDPAPRLSASAPHQRPVAVDEPWLRLYASGASVAQAVAAADAAVRKI